jgi:hypothetical protein
MSREMFHYLGLGAIATHELDAVSQHEWRLLYVLRTLPEDLARHVFIGLHVPLFALLVWLTSHSQPRVREGSRIALAAFLVIHAGLHWRLSDDALYTFHDGLSQALIATAGICGALYLALTWGSSRWRN